MFLFFSCQTPDKPKDSAGPTESTTTTETTPFTIDEVSWAVHDEIQSIIVVEWSQTGSEQSWVEFEVDPGEWRSSPSETRDAGTHTELLLGVPFAHDVDFRITSESTTSKVFTARSGDPPKGLPGVTLGVSTPSAQDPGGNWLLIATSTGGFGTGDAYKVIVDRQGRVVWAHLTDNTRRTNAMQVSQDGTAILWDANSFWTLFDEGAKSVFHRMKIDGTIVETVAIPGMHHTFMELPDGAVVWGGFKDGDEVVQERTPDGTVRTIWDCEAHWQAKNASLPCDGNGLFYNADDDTIYYSSDNETAVVELDRSSGALLRIWGGIDGAWPFSKGSGRFYKQHSPTRTAEGNLMISTQISGTNRELTAREYEIDDKNQVLREVWSCDDAAGILANHSGEAWRVGNGNTIINYGPGHEVREYTPDCELVWQIDFDGGSLTKASFIEDLYALAP